MFSQRSVLPRLFISVVLAACLFCGTGIADEKSTQANSARSLNTSQDTLQEGDGRVHGRSKSVSMRRASASHSLSVIFTLLIKHRPHDRGYGNGV